MAGIYRGHVFLGKRMKRNRVKVPGSDREVVGSTTSESSTSV